METYQIWYMGYAPPDDDDNNSNNEEKETKLS